jgi:hypothetical protein
MPAAERVSPRAASTPPAPAPERADAARRSPLIKDQLELRRVKDASGAERVEARPLFCRKRLPPFLGRCV